MSVRNRFVATVMTIIGIGTVFVSGTSFAQSAATSRAIVRRLGISMAEGRELAATVQATTAEAPRAPDAVGVPEILNVQSPLSTAVLAAVGGRGTQFAELDALADWDGKEDFTADHGRRLANLAGSFTLPGQMITRAAVSEHTASNGFTENIYYYGDSAGNLYVGVDSNLDGTIDDTLTLNLPTALNAFGTLNSDSQIVITGIAVNPVSDHTAFANVNGSFAPFSGKIGEMLLVTFWDAGGGLRLTSGNQLVHSGVLAFPIADDPSPAVAPPGIQSDTGFPITVGGAFGVAFSTFANLAGCAIDDDGNAYFQQVDLEQLTGGNIVKITGVDDATNQDRSFATNGFATLTTLNPSGGNYGTASGPANQINRFTNYSGTSTLFGDIAALGSGPGNVVYAAVARSWGAGDDPGTQATEGPFPGPAGVGDTPSMVISFVDFSGATAGGGQPIPDGFADSANGDAIVPGVNNYRVFVMGNGPDLRADGSWVFGSAADTLKLDMQVDYTIFGGVLADEAGTVFAISGGTPAGVGTNPSPTRGEILAFPDDTPEDRRADAIDLRGNQLPNPPSSGGNLGDGDSDRFDHIWWMAPVDPVSATPLGITGLTRGFLMYLNRTRNDNAANSTWGALPNGDVQGDNDTAGPLFFGHFDPGHQAGGGDDQNPPFTGDDDDGGGSPAITNVLEGGFEYVFGGSACPAEVWNAFYLNSNGTVSFGAGDTSSHGNVTDWLTGPPNIGNGTDLNPGTRATHPNTFPVQALGYAGVNQFIVRYIDVPSFGSEDTSSSTFSISLFDDGTGVDENANQPLNPANPIGNNAVPFDHQEGPTDLRWTMVDGVLQGAPPRPDGSGRFTLQFGTTDLTGEPTGNHVITGYSIGGLAPDEAHEIDLSETAQYGTIGGGSEVAVFESFTSNDYDLRAEGNWPQATTPPLQPDLNTQRLDFAGFDCGVLAPVKLNVDTAGNGVLEPGEAVDIKPVWSNGTAASNPGFQSLMTNFTGPNDPDPSFSIDDPLASYPAIPATSSGTCDLPDGCFQVTLGTPTVRPSQHWDTQITEHLATGVTKTWVLHIGNSFPDVPSNNIFYRFVESVFHHHVTEGCGGGLFCITDPIPRKEIAKWLLLAKEGELYEPPGCVAGSEVFSDVPAADPFCPWIEELAHRGITAGCGGGNYCPDASVDREQISVLALKTFEGGAYVPPPCAVAPFGDVATASPFCPWIQEFSVRGITAGCGGGLFCPFNFVDRGQMSVFVAKSFGLELYGP